MNSQCPPDYFCAYKMGELTAMKHHKLGYPLRKDRNYIVLEDACFFEAIEWVMRYFAGLNGLPADIRVVAERGITAAVARDYDTLRGLADEGRSLCWKYRDSVWLNVASPLMMAFGGWSNGTTAKSKSPDEVTAHFNEKFDAAANPPKPIAESTESTIDPTNYCRMQVDIQTTKESTARYVKE
jgi:hypothetical protein